MHSITSFSYSKLNNAEFVGFTVNIGNLIERAEATNLGLETDLLSSFTAKKAKLIDQVYATTGSQYTANMKTSDTKRDKIAKRILMKYQIVSLAEEGSALLPFKDRTDTYILSKYTVNLINMPQHEESAVIQGLIHDSRTIFSEDDLDDMDLTLDLTNLETANQEFIAAYANRADERAAGDTGLTLRLRSEMVDILSQIYNTVQFYANSTLEANATKTTACQAFIAVLNITIADVKKRWNQRTGGVETTPNGGAEAADGGNDTPGSNDTSGDVNGGSSANPSGGNNTPSGNTPAGGNDTPNGNTPAGGNDTPSGSNDIDRENGTVHDGTVEY